jgi:hypothetical protein
VFLFSFSSLLFFFVNEIILKDKEKEDLKLKHFQQWTLPI